MFSPRERERERERERDVGTSYHFPICLEVCNHGIDMYKCLLGKPPLRFNSSVFLQPHFDSLMQQILVNFSKEANLKGVEAWDITLQNINIIHRMYGVTIAQRRRTLIQLFSQVLSRCNALLIHAPLDEELLDISKVNCMILFLSCNAKVIVMRICDN